MKKIFSLLIAALVCAGMYADKVYFVNAEDWPSVNVYMWNGGDKNANWPGEAMTKTEATAKGFAVFSYEVPEGFTNIIFSNNGSNQTADLTFDAAKPYFYENVAYASLEAIEATEEPENVTAYFVNDADWATVNAYVFESTWYKKWPGETMTKTANKANEKDVYSYEFPKTYSKIIFNDGTTQTADLTFDAAKPYYSYANEKWYATLGEVPAPATEVDSTTLYFVNANDWEKVQVYAYDATFAAYKTWPGEALAKTAETALEKAVYAYTFPSKYVTVIFNNKTGEEGVQTADLAWDAEKPYFLINEAANAEGKFEGKWYATIEEIEASVVPVEPTLANGYYLITEPWTVESLSAEALFAENENQAGEYLLTTTLTEGDSIKVVAVANDAITTWFPEGKNIAIDAKHAGEKTIYFRPVANNDWKEFHESGLFWIDATPDPVEEGLWKATAETPVAAGSVYIDNNLLKVEGVYLSFIAGTSHKYSDELDFKKALQIRTNGYPTEENKNAAEFSASEAKKHGTSLILTVKEDIDITFYYRRQSSNTTRVDPDDNKSEIVSVVHEQNDSKDLCVFDQAAITTKLEGIYTIVDGAEEEYAFATKKVSLKKDHVYTLTASGTTLPLFGIQYEVTPTFVDLQLVPGVWTEHDAILAAWVWQTGKNGNWVVFEGEGDTLSAKINEKADSVIFVRFADTVTVLRWDAEGDTVIWNRTEEQEIADCRLFFVNDWDKYSWCEAVEPPTPATEDGYYLVGSLTDWKALKDYRFTANGEVEGEYLLETSLSEGDEFKVAELKESSIADEDWYLSENHVVTAEEAGAVTIYFRPDGQGGEDWIEGIIYIDKGGSTAIDNTAVGAKAVKILQNGQLLITRDGKTYTIIGTRVR